MDLTCTKCKGTGELVFGGWARADGSTYPESRHKCSSCCGTGQFAPIDEKAILEAIMATKGKNKGKIRASMSSSDGFRKRGDATIPRAYYVWRIARFHGGVDVTMPIMADTLISGDPCKKELDALADKVAKEQFGSNMRAAIRWGRALGAL